MMFGNFLCFSLQRKCLLITTYVFFNKDNECNQIKYGNSGGLNSKSDRIQEAVMYFFLAFLRDFPLKVFFLQSSGLGCFYSCR